MKDDSDYNQGYDDAINGRKHKRPASKEYRDGYFDGMIDSV